MADWAYLPDPVRAQTPARAPSRTASHARPRAQQRTGCSYFANLRTGEVRWDAPPELYGGAAEDAGSGALPEGWHELLDEASGSPYYYNEHTGTTSWDRPAAGQVDTPSAALAKLRVATADDYVSDDEDDDPMGRMTRRTASGKHSCSSLVSAVRAISTSFITCTGLK